MTYEHGKVYEFDAGGDGTDESKAFDGLICIRYDSGLKLYSASDGGEDELCILRAPNARELHVVNWKGWTEGGPPHFKLEILEGPYPNLVAARVAFKLRRAA